MSKNDKKYSYLLRNVSILTVSNFSSKILVFLLVPLYTSVLTTEEYGIYDLSVSTVQLLYPILTLNIVDAVMRFSMDKSYSGNAVASVGFRFVAGSVLAAAAIAAIVGVFGLLPSAAGLEPLIFLYYTFYVLNQYFIQLAKGLERVELMAVASVIGTVVMVGANLLFLLMFHWGLKGFFIANILAQAVPALYYFFSLRFWERLIRVSDGKRIGREMLSYCVPLIFTTLGWWANSTADKYTVAFLCGVAANGILSVAYKIPSILNVVQGIFTQAWQISAIKEYGGEDTAKFYGRSFTYVNMCISLCCAVLICMNKLIASFLYAKDFYVAWRYVPFLLISCTLNTASGFLGPILSARKDSGAMAKSAVYGTIVNIAMNICLVYFFGIQGATVATVISSYVIYRVRLGAVKGVIDFEGYWKVIVTWGILCVQAVISVYVGLPVLQVLLMALLAVLYIKELRKFAKKGLMMVAEMIEKAQSRRGGGI